MIAKITCPKCGEEIESEESAMADGILCQSCGHDFIAAATPEPEPEPIPEPEPVPPASPDPVISPPPPPTKAQILARKRADLHELADGLVLFGGIFVFAGFMTLTFGILMVASSNAWGYLVVGFGAAFISLWPLLYLIAQVVHIRANTERND